MEWLTAIPLGINFLTIIGFVFALGKRDQKLKDIEDRLKEDREKNTDQHKEFYENRNTVTKITAQFEDFGRRLEGNEGDVKEILSRLPRGGI